MKERSGEGGGSGGGAASATEQHGETSTDYSTDKPTSCRHSLGTSWRSLVCVGRLAGVL